MTPVTQDEALGRAAAWRRGPLLLGVVAAAVVALSVVVLLAADAGWVQRLDRYLNRAWVGPAVAHDGWAVLVRAVTFWGNTPVVLALGAGAVVWQLVRRRPVLAAWVATTLVTGWLLNSALKHSVGRVRPATDGLLIDALGTSFPSGHAQVGGYGWVTFGLLALLVLRGRGRLWAAWLCWGTGALIAASRVVLGVHWPTDVAAGYAVGVGWALLSAVALVGVARRRTPAARPAAVTASPGAW